MSFVQKNTVVLTAPGTTQTPSLTGVAAGNLLVLMVAWDTTVATAGPTLDAGAVTAGWKVAINPTGVQAVANSSWFTASSIFYLQNAPAGTNSCKINFANSAFFNTQIAEFAGYATSGALDQVGQQALTSGTTITTTSPSTTQANELVISLASARFAASNSNIGMTTPPTGFTALSVVQDTNSSSAYSFAYKEVTTTGVQSTTHAWSGTGEAQGVIVTFGQTGASPASLSSPTSSGIGSTTSTVGATTNQGSGTLYAVAYTGTQPSAAQIKAGQNSSGTTTPNASVTVSSTGAKTVNLTGLTASTSYNYALAQNNANGDSNVVTGTFTTSATPPTISALSSSSVAYLGSLTLTTTNAGASQGAGSVSIGGVAQTITSWADTSITDSPVARGSLAYGSTTVTVTNNAGGISSGFAMTLTPQAGWSYVTLTSPGGSSTNYITATGALATGDQVAYDNKSGKLIVNADGSFVYDPTGGFTSFNCEAWTPSGGWGPTETQTLSAAITPLPVSIVIS